MGLRDEITEWTQPDGLISPDHNPTVDSTGNGLLYLSLYLILLQRRRELRPEDVVAFEVAVSKCKLENGQWILNRSQTKGGNEQNSKDDYIGVVYASLLLGSRIAWRILDAGNRYHFGLFKWFYKNLKPSEFHFFKLETWKGWFGKWPNVVAHMQWCGNVKPHGIRRIFWILAFVVTSTKSHSTCIGMNLMAMAHPGPDAMEDLALDFWYWRFNRRYPNGMKDCLEKELSALHPIAKYWI